MVGIEGYPQFFGNALDFYRNVIFANRSEAARIRAEFVGDPQDPRAQNAPGLYTAHVPVSLRKPPHVWGLVHGHPVHSMLAEFCRHTVQLPPDAVIMDCPSSGTTCVILTVRTDSGGVEVLVWQWQHYFALAEGMTFNLLDRMDGNVPAVVSGGMLRIDPSGIFPDAPENIHRLWQQAETSFLQRYMGMNPGLPQGYLEWDQMRLSRWWTRTRDSQQRQQSEYRRRISQLGPYTTSPPLPQDMVLGQESVLVSLPREEMREASEETIEISSSSEDSTPPAGEVSNQGVLATEVPTS